MGTAVGVSQDEVKGGFSVLPAGSYVCKLTGVEEGLSHSTGNPMLIWDWEVMSPAEHFGAELRSWTSLQAHALSGCKQHFKAFGATWKAGDILENLAKKFLQKRATVVVSIRQSEDRETGEPRVSNRVERILAVSEGAGKVNAASPKSSNRATPSIDDKDVPF